MIKRSQLGEVMAGFDRDVYDLACEYGGSGPYSNVLFIPSFENMDLMIRRIHCLQREIDAYKAPSPVDQVVKEHLLEVLQWLDLTLVDDALYPVRFMAGLNGLIASYVYLFPELVKDEDKVRRLLAKFAPLEAFLDAVYVLCQRVDDDRLQQCLRRAQALVVQLREGVKEVGQWREGSALATRWQKAGEVTEAFVGRLEELKSRSRECSPLLPYEKLVTDKFAFDLNWVLSWYEEDLAEAKDRLAREGARLDPDASPFTILETKLGPYGSPEDMFGAARAATDHARRHALRYVTLPEGEYCEISGLMPAQADQLPWGAYGNADMAPEALRGKYFLNQFNYEAVTRGWVLMMAVHEVYPGHHTHYVKTYSQELPWSFLISAFGHTQGLVEGLAHRSEELLIDIFDEKAYPLFVYYRQLHTTLRIKTQIDLSVYGRSPEKVALAYVEGMGLSPESARMQVYSQQMNPGRTFSYYYGMKVLNERFPRYGLSVAEYTNRIFSCGFTSLDTVDRLLQLP